MLPFSTMIIGASGNVIDKANIIDDSQKMTLQAMSDNIKNKYGLETVIVTIESSGDQSSMAYADDYFDYNGYGVGDDHEGILLLVNFSNEYGNREVWISTSGPRTISKYQPLIDPILDEVAPLLSNQDYTGASLEFLGIVDHVEDTGKIKTYGERVGHMLTSPIPYLAALVIAAIATLALTYSSKSKVTTSGRNYESSDSFKLTKERDDFINEHVTRQAIPKNNSSSGGGSHTGSSGSSHGGGGRSF